jgi:predicted secreted hydrolase
VVLPRDDASHPVSAEWWYYNGHLTAEDGGRYGFHLVFFEVVPSVGVPVVHIGHFAVTDHQRGSYTTAQEMQPRRFDPSEQGFRAVAGKWSATGAGGDDTLAASAGDYSMRLRLSTDKPAILHDDDGLLQVPGYEDSFYYSRTRMRGAGILVDGGRELRVDAQAWMDHQWGAFVSVDIGWDWFSLQLEDDTDLMLTVVRDATGAVVKKYGTLVAKDGTVTGLGPTEFAVEATGSWTSPRTGAVYPSGWNVSVPAAGVSLDVVPVVRDSELDSRSTTQNYYWEGQVSAQGRKDGEPMAALGFVELTGY